MSKNTVKIKPGQYSVFYTDFDDGRHERVDAVSVWNEGTEGVDSTLRVKYSDANGDGVLDTFEMKGASIKNTYVALEHETAGGLVLNTKQFSDWSVDTIMRHTPNDEIAKQGSMWGFEIDNTIPIENPNDFSITGVPDGSRHDDTFKIVEKAKWNDTQDKINTYRVKNIDDYEGSPTMLTNADRPVMLLNENNNLVVENSLNALNVTGNELLSDNWL